MTAFKNRALALLFMLVFIPMLTVVIAVLAVYELFRDELRLGEFLKDAYSVSFRAFIDGERVDA